MSYLADAKRCKRIRPLAATRSCALVLSLCATAISGQTKTTTHEKPDWEHKIVPGSQLTVLALARRIMPDIKSDPSKADKITASDLSIIRMLDGVQPTGMELDPDSSDESEITEADYFWMKDGGYRLLVLLLKVNVEGVVIGLFKVSPEVGLLDAVTIAQDMHVDVNREKVWAIHPQHQAFSVQCWHDNSSESFDSYTFVSVVDRKLRAVAGPIVSSGFATYSTARQRLCKTSMTPKFQFVSSQGRGYFDLVENEMTLKVCHRESEEWSWKTGVVYRKSVRRLWQWSVKKRQYRRVSINQK
jgi:hypothetical protein